MKKFVAILLAMTTLIGLVACGGGNNADNGANDGSPRTDLVFGLTGDPQSMDPAMTTDQMSKAIWYQIYDTCIIRDGKGGYLPGLAEEWNISEDGKTVTLKIREGVKFHDGGDLTAEDIAFSLKRLTESPQTTSKMVSMTPESFIVEDDYTLRIEMETPFGAILDVLACDTRIISKKAFEQMGEEEFNNHPVGSGPYKFVERKTGEKIVLTANEEYWRGSPTIKDITFRIMTDSNTAVLALEKGELDFLSHAPLTARQTLMDNPDIEWYETEIAGSVYINFNMETGHFTDPLVREAVSYAVDKEEMVLAAVEGNGTPMATMAPPSDFGYIADIEDTPYDPERAKELLAEAGYPDGFTVKTITQENATYQKPTEVLQGQLRKVGINMEIEVLERGVFNDQMHASNFEILVGHWTTPIPDAYFIMYTMGHSSNIGNQNFCRINVPELDEQLDIIKTSTDTEERLEAYRKAHEIVQEQTLWVPLYTFMAACAANKDLKGVTADPVYKYEVFNYSW